jgi:hypothetical protein
VEPSRVIPGRDQQRPSGLRADPTQLAQSGRRLGGESIKLGIDRGQLDSQGLIALTQHAQG